VTARAVLVLVVSAGCAGDPSVSVRFEVPAPYRDLVDAVSLEVLASEELDCDAVALGNASAQEQASARVAEALVRQPGDEAPLSGIPRTGSKLFVARALSVSDQLIAAGCAEAGTIDGNREVVIEGELALTLGARDLPSAGPLPEQVTILVSDARGSPVEGAPALQTVYAAADTRIPGDPATSGPGGALRFEVAQPEWAGPQVLDVDVRWQANQRDQLAGFKTPFLRFAAAIPRGAEPEALPTQALYQVGRIGPGGEMGVAALGPDEGSGNRTVSLFYSNPDATDVIRVDSDSAVRASAIGLIADDGGREVVVAMNATTFYRIGPDGSVDPVAGAEPMNASALAPMSDCQPGSPRDRLLAVSDTGQVALFRPDGTRVPDWRGEQLSGVVGLLAAGCVRGLEDTLPAAVYMVRGELGERAALAIDVPDTQPAPVSAAVDRGFAFTPLLDSGEGPFLLANRFENDGNSIARYTVVPVEGAPTFLDERDQDDIAGVAATSAGGDFDGDGLLDVAAMVTVPAGDGRVAFRFFMALGIVVEDERLFGLGATGVDDPDFAPLLLAADFDQDGVDELFLAIPDGFSVFELSPD
jgi:hypothetical protein